MRLERCLKLGPRLPPSSQIKRLVSGAALKFDRLYIGEEFCENLLPGPKQLAACAGALLAEGKKVCVLTPPVSEKGLAVLADLFAGLKKIKNRAGNLDLTVNDFGALELAGKSRLGVKLNAGRLLRHNAFQTDKDSLRVIDTRCLEAFAELGISRFEVAVASKKFRTNFPRVSEKAGAGDFRLTMYYPYYNITSARTCLLGTPEAGRHGSVRTIDCRRECETAAFEIVHPFIKEKIVMRGNTLFLRFTGELGAEKSLLASRIDRLVYDPFR